MAKRRKPVAKSPTRSPAVTEPSPGASEMVVTPRAEPQTLASAALLSGAVSGPTWGPVWAAGGSPGLPGGKWWPSLRTVGKHAVVLVLMWLPFVWAAVLTGNLPREARGLLIAACLLTPWVVPVLLAGWFRPSLRMPVVLAAMSGLMWWLSFPPMMMWPLAAVALAPWAVMVATTSSRWDVALASVAMLQSMLGTTVYWVHYPTELGWAGVTFMATGYYAGAVALMWWIRTRLGWPWTVLLPVVWTATEYLRTWGEITFPWGFVGHTFAEAPVVLVQIADATGVYGVSVLALATAGLLADAWLKYRHSVAQEAPPSSWRRWPIGRGVSVAALWAVVIIYGLYRLAEAEATQTPGPRILAVQTNVPQYVKENLRSSLKKTHGEYFREDLAMTRAAARAETPDLIVWPETSVPVPLNPDFINWDAVAVVGSDPRTKPFRDLVAARQEECRATLAQLLMVLQPGRQRWLIGYPAEHLELTADGRGLLRRPRNSAVLLEWPIGPDGRPRFDVSGRGLATYSKIRLVPWGEYPPGRESLPWLVELFASFAPGGILPNLYAGNLAEFRPFCIPGPDGRDCRLASPICFEGTLPDLVRDLVYDPQTGGKRVDVLVNLSNDGWFEGSSELDMHFGIATFRAVEHRVGLVRSTNTGGTGFVDPSGRRGPSVLTDGRDRLVTGTVAADVMLDSRVTLYTRYGDVLGRALVVLATLATLLATFRPFRLSATQNSATGAENNA